MTGQHENYTRDEIGYLSRCQWNAIVYHFPTTVAREPEWELWSGLYNAAMFWTNFAV